MTTAITSAINSAIGTLTKSSVGLSNVDNTADVNKPVSTAASTALALKAPLASPAFTGTVSGVSASMVGLSNVSNTSDASKPVSTAQAAANLAIAFGPGLVPAINYSVGTPGISGYTTSTPVYQRQIFLPVYVGPGGFTADAIGYSIGTAYSGATTPTTLVALYANDPTTNYPKTDSMLASSTTAGVTTATGSSWVTFSAPVVLAQGWYWMSHLLAGPAVTTAGTTVNSTSTGIPFPISAGLAIGTNVRCLCLSGVTVLKTTATTPNGFALGGGSDQPVLQLRRSA
jgi:hypothetical protein